MHWFGSEDGYNILIMDLLGPSLEDLLQYCDKTLTVRTIIMIADQMVLKHIYIYIYVYIYIYIYSFRELSIFTVRAISTET